MRRFRYPFARRPDSPPEEEGELWGGAVCAEDLARLGHEAKPFDDCSSATSDCGVGRPARIRLPARCRAMAPANWSVWVPDDHGVPAHEQGVGLRQTALQLVLATVADTEERPREIEIRVAAG